jgi:hypothetical protein
MLKTDTVGRIVGLPARSARLFLPVAWEFAVSSGTPEIVSCPITGLPARISSN